MEADPGSREPRANYHFLTSCVMPRPIAWITTVDPKSGVVNAAPFSWYNAVCADPPMVMTAILERSPGVLKDTVRNIRATKEYVVNVSPRSMVEPMVKSSGDYPPDVSEVKELGLRTVPSRKVRPPRLADSPVHLECRLDREIPLGRTQKVSLVLGEVVHMAADDAVLDARGNVDPAKLVLAARLGGSEYSDTERFFTVKRPPQADPLRRGS
ncbi:MAG TPA: flavin reductase family protein [Candidatus Thermoplasmatota archaeon]|nr:flavin reductase family protein [Candidatus Thermoplasmatota archaeon]